MKPILIPASYNYIGVFLCLRCNLNCSYCINNFGTVKKDWKELSGEDWIKGLSRIQTREDLPLSLQGGEPTLHKDFYRIARGLHYNGKSMDLLTNGMFDAISFCNHIDTFFFNRDAKYANIRFSFHKDTNLIGLATKVYDLKKDGYNVGIWGLNHPHMEKRNAEMADLCKWLGIDFRMKEFLDEDYKGYKYPDAINGKELKHVKCKPSEMLISPDGSIYRCHSELYAGRNPVGHILDESVSLTEDFTPCSTFGNCNCCDIKIKTDRFQVNGHTSVEIKT